MKLVNFYNRKLTTTTTQNIKGGAKNHPGHIFCEWYVGRSEAMGTKSHTAPVDKPMMATIEGE